MTASDPTAIRSLAVTLSDVVTAYEARQRGGRRTVLRVTPPFSGRMRARLHEAGSATANARSNEKSGPDLDPESGALHLPPSRFVGEEAVSSYPEPDETEDALRTDPDAEFSVDRHRERHVEAVEEWREAVRGAIADRVEIRLTDGTHEVDVKLLGEDSGA
jgi:hypothetical protein